MASVVVAPTTPGISPGTGATGIWAEELLGGSSLVIVMSSVLVGLVPLTRIATHAGSAVHIAH